jgi:hypothetical protein
MTGDVADRCPGELVAMVESAHARSSQDIADGRAGEACEIGQTMGSEASLDTSREDDLDLVPRERAG